MRTFIFIVFLIAPVNSWSQPSAPGSITLDGAIKTALNNKPGLTEPQARKNLIFELKKNWYNWLFSINRCILLKEYQNSISDLERIADLRYQSGDIDFYESASKMNMIAEILTNSSIYDNQSLQYQNRIKQLMYIDSEVQPSDSSLELYEVDKSSEYEAKIFASDSLNEYDKFVMDLEIENMQIELDNLFLKLQYYRTFGLGYAENILNMATAKLRSEDIDYLEYADFVTNAFKIRLEYLEVLNQYNQCAIQLEQYAY
ncbi:MAG TPA: hypothetical protein VHI78_11655 [Bacteroidales bacterium]|nr:hypothetical protein [Bacteroidales bacterium]